MRRLLFSLAVLLAAVPAFAQQEMTFEAEDVCGPETAYGKDISPTDKWNVWSKDNDAAKKWSAGKVVQSPQVMADREKPEDGAPPLRITLPGIPKGAWIVTVKFGRELGVSLDGKEWKRLSETGGRLGRFDIPDGKFEFWVDDRWADKKNPGFGYLDSITLTPAMPETRGIANGSFEFGQDFRSSGWSWFSRDNAGAVELVPEPKEGKRAAKFVYPGEKDFALTNAGRLDVKPGQSWIVTAWMKCQDTEGANLDVVAMGGGKLLTWNLASDGVWGTRDWTQVRAQADIPPGCDQVYVRVTGSGKATVWLDDLAFAPGTPAPPKKPKTKVTGWAKQRVVERLDRGVVAMPVEGGKVYVGWRLLKSDPANVAFNLYRAAGPAQPVKVNAAPLTKTTDLVDERPTPETELTYTVRPVVGGKEGPASAPARVAAKTEGKPYLSLKLQGDYTFQKAGIADLNGDGKLDYVIKTPQDNIDPYIVYWTPSPDTYKLEAYLNDGTFLWRHDMGWAIERGIWYSPYLVYDLDGDGKAEVAVKAGEGDPREADGRVRSGAEHVLILDGATGKEKARMPWPDRRAFGGGGSGYNLASRNQIGIAYLDGKTPCLLVARGTYTVMQCIAYQFQGGKLQELWAWDNRDETEGNWRGQGAHWMHAGDVDGDGRDEVVLGSCVIDDDGKGLWTTGLGHPDRCFLTDIDPTNPGMEIFYHLETPQPKDGLCIVDARTGKILWGLQERTYHVGMGMIADIDPLRPGVECWASEDPKGAPKGDKYHNNPPRWLVSAKGEILARDEKVPPFTAVYWDADALREVVAGRRVQKFNGPAVFQDLEGHQAVWADILGDWREEIITSVKGELRIYTTTIPATDRRVCLLQDPVYRFDVAHLAMGYAQSACTSYAITQSGPAVWMRTSSSTIRVGEAVTVKAVLAAPAKEGVSGIVRLVVPEGLSVDRAAAPLSAPAGGVAEAEFTVSLQAKPAPLSGGKNYALTLSLEGAERVSAAASVRAEEEVLKDLPMAQAEDVAGQGGGTVQVRTDKIGADGKSLSHWDSEGHWLTWKVTVPAEGDYRLVLRYCTPLSVQREVQVDAAAPVKTPFYATGGFSGDASDWAHGVVRSPDGKHLVLHLTAGEHTVKMTNVDGKGMNLDYLALMR